MAGHHPDRSGRGDLLGHHPEARRRKARPVRDRSGPPSLRLDEAKQRAITPKSGWEDEMK
jgi:hypothetical protein